MYTITVLEDKEFDQLPYKNAKTAFGCADPKTNKAFVRKTHWGEISKTVDLLNIQHELDELVAKTSPHEEDGIRYKSGGTMGKIFAPLVGMIPGVGPLLAMGLAAGTGAYSRSKKPEKYGANSFFNIAKDALMGGALGKVGGALGSGFGAGFSGAQSAGQGLFSSMLSGGKSAFMGSGAVPGTGLTGGAGSATGFAAQKAAYSPGLKGLVGSFTSGISEKFGGLLGSGGASAGATGGGGGFSLSNPLAKLGMGLMGMSALSTSPKTPNLGDITSKWLNADTVTKAGEAAKNIADVEYAGEFQPSKEIQGFIEVQGKDIAKAYDQRLKQLDNSMAAMNTGWKRSGERLEMHRRINEERQSEIDKMQAQWLATAKQEHSQNQYNYVMKQLDIDESVKRDLLYAEMSQVMHQYNVEQADLLNFRQLAADAGMYLMTGAGA